MHSILNQEGAGVPRGRGKLAEDMKRYTVVTEGPQDVLILRTLLGADATRDEVQFISAGGYSSADSLARSILILDFCNYLRLLKNRENG